MTPSHTPITHKPELRLSPHRSLLWLKPRQAEDYNSFMSPSASAPLYFSPSLLSSSRQIMGSEIFMRLFEWQRRWSGADSKGAWLVTHEGKLSLCVSSSSVLPVWKHQASVKPGVRVERKLPSVDLTVDRKLWRKAAQNLSFKYHYILTINDRKKGCRFNSAPHWEKALRLLSGQLISGSRTSRRDLVEDALSLSNF